MNYKKITINSILIFLICSLFHFGYSTFPNFLTSLFFPVNESVWEHLKLIFTSTVVFSFLSNLFYKENNIYFKAYIRSMSTIIILLLLYLPFTYLFGEVMIITLLILFISIFITEIIVNKIKIKKHSERINLVSAFMLTINLLIFIYLTYYPIKADLFLDKQSNKYGIDILNK